MESERKQTALGVAVADADEKTERSGRLSRIIERVLQTAPLRKTRLAREDWLYVLGVFVASRVLILVVSIIAAAIFPQVGPRQTLVLSPLGESGQDMLARLYAHFDSGWYIGISHGYSLPGSRPDWLVEWAFFPLYPLVLHPVSVFLGLLHLPGNADVLAGALVSHAALLAAMLLLYGVAAAELSPTAARRTVLYLAVFPASCALSSVYPEGLFLLLSVGAFYAARRRVWPLAGLLAALSLLTRAQGLFLLLPLLLEFAAAYRAAGRERGRRLLQGLWLGLPLVALGGFALFSHAETGYWLAFSTAQTRLFGHRATPPFYPLLRYLLAPDVGSPFDFDFRLPNFVCAVGFLLLILVAWKRLPPSYSLWLAICVLFPLSANGHVIAGFVRYMATAFPAFLALAAWSIEHRWTPGGVREGHLSALALDLRDRLILAPSLLLAATYIVMFVNGYYGAA